MTRKQMVETLYRFNPFAGRDYYEGLTTEQLRETLERLEKVASPRREREG